MEIKKTYDHKGLESKWYEKWEKSGYFKADPDSGKPRYSIVIPPPNVTGVLHMGHALTVTIQDIMARFKRMTGHDVLWLPGTDHAGIATQMVVERSLMKDGVSRHDLGREKFLEKVWEWKEKHGNGITGQLRSMGSSLDWSRERFTMDEGLSKAVKEVFVRLYKEGLIYKDNYIINWCPRCRTAISDLEVDYQDKEGSLWHIKYPVVGEDTFLEIATTRPETMLGDTAVAVHPEDERLKHLIGKKIMLPIMNREIPIIGDAELVDMEFGTGAVKVTPAHDFNDFATGKRHNLEEINVIDEQGCINANGGEYEGLDVKEARKKIVEKLESLGLLIKIEKYGHSVGHCDRCKTVVEPILSRQWFVKIEPLAKPAIEAVETGKIKFTPKHWEKTYYEWMYNIRDWCISRQLWWGHRIPAYYCEECGETIVATEEPACCTKCESKKLRQDPDVLDTWFSSALWPFSTLGWPEKTSDLKKYYPTSLMETAPDIIFFWVARMIMMGLKFMEDIPFEKVFFHGLITDEKGQKMSKTKGNGIDPLDMTEKYGADALRFNFATMPVTQRHMKLSIDSIENCRGFINKIYNAVRFCLLQFEEGEVLQFDPSAYVEDDFSPADRWILTRLNQATKNVKEALEEMKLHEASGAIYHFFWHEFCDWYIELIKPVLYGDDEAEKLVAKKTLMKVLDASLKLLHPFMPFATEELWQSLPFKSAERKDSIMISRMPEEEELPVFEDDSRTMESIVECIKAIRNIRSENNIKPSTEIDIVLDLDDKVVEKLMREREIYLRKLARVAGIKYTEAYTPGEKTASAILQSGKVFIDLEGLVDFSEEIKRIEKELAKLMKDFQLTEKKLGNENFLGRAKPDVVEKEKKKYAEMKEKIDYLNNRLGEINK